ncbi:MAG: methyltransferase domain-containing protein [Woeseiaceae bacterium]|nr:methyltransferase domain-containing protein [Woeseiaceae bacterium]
MSDTAKFWDKIADRYSKKPISDEQGYEKKLEVTRKYFTPDSNVLEFGCGTGSTAILHAPYVKQILATDLSPRMIEIARERAADAQATNASFDVASIESLDASAGSFDVVLGLSILHLLEDWESAIEKIFGLLKPGGVFVSSTVCLGDNMRWFRFVGPIGRALGLMPLVQIFRKSELEEGLKNAGFRIEYDWQQNARVAFFVARKPG